MKPAKAKTVRLKFPVKIVFPPEHVGTESANLVMVEAPSGAVLVAQVHALHLRCRYPRAACRCGGQSLYHMWRAGIEFSERLRVERIEKKRGKR